MKGTSSTHQQLKARSVVTLFLLRCRPVGGPGSQEPFEAPVNLGTWEPDSISILSSYGAKAVSEVKSHLRCKISLNYMRGWSVFE